MSDYPDSGIARRDVDTIRFEVEWLGYSSSDVVGRGVVRRETLDDAIRWAAGGVVKHPTARGFHVRQISLVAATESSRLAKDRLE